MCGICFILCSTREEIKLQNGRFSSLLFSRGPDIIHSQIIQINKELLGLFHGCVLWLQGKKPQQQPVVDEDGNIFLWNGDNLSLERDRNISDTYSICQHLQGKTEEEFLSYLSSIEGPWSFIYFSSARQMLYFGRDVFGRRSLLWTPPHLKGRNFILTSVARRDEGLEEVPALGIYSADISSLVSECDTNLTLFPFHTVNPTKLCDLKSIQLSEKELTHNITIPLCTNLPEEATIKALQNYPLSLEGDDLQYIETVLHEEITLFTQAFKRSIQKRINACPSSCKDCTHGEVICSHPKFAVLFSGGLDSAMIALFLSQCLPAGHPIDLLNVSFENEHRPQVVGRRSQPGDKDNARDKVLSPDRESGLICWRELQAIDSSRKWNFVEIDISAQELEAERMRTIHHLIAPQSSVLDDSIGCALYFSGRGIGLCEGKAYTSRARVVFSGLGADEQLAGYSRHRGRFEQSRWNGLVEETKLEMSRIHARNCGRDDRVLSHHGRTVRFPFLDKDVVNCLNSFPMWKKANLYLPRGLGEKLLLRVVAARYSLKSAAVLPKRAIQFGSRIAKLENRKEKGTDFCARLQQLPRIVSS